MQPSQVCLPRNSFKIIPSVYLLLCRGGQILLLKRDNTSYEDGNYGLVSWHVEANETLREAVVREAAEEVGLDLNTSDIDVALVMHRFAATSIPAERMDFFMGVENWQGKIINLEPSKCSELDWFDIQNLPSNVIPYIRQALIEIAAGNRYCEYGWTDRKEA